ncbi:MAG: LLM class flavin-dependent oxidoreductase [Proteobacteria bacterium]|nr:LLM class flavin-dependent oxidoreductase [Pseudomonadota bacterium]
MRLGALLSIHDGARPGSLPEQARLFESEGYSSIWAAQAIGRGFMLTDPFIALAAVAAATEKVEIGTAILQLPLYSPTDIALKSWSLQQISDGRLSLGVGAGSTRSDYASHEMAFENRFAAFESKLSQLRQIYETGAANDHDLTPWPNVSDAPSLLFGTWGRNVTRAATEFDGWVASGMHRGPEECAQALIDYRAAGGRRAIVSTIRVPAGRDTGELRDRLLAYEAAGFDDAVVMFLPGAPGLAEVRALLP